ncbi:MAG TPA: hypothetical protein P5539_05685 [Mesotoga sp.]|nr:hypothetical protein [Mesotoga sp.]
MKTTLLVPEMITEHWHEVKDLLQSAIDHGVGESTLTDYLRKLMNWQAQLWVFHTDEGQLVGAGLTQFLDYSTHRTLHIIAVAGIEWSSWADQYYIVEEFAKKNNCKAVEQWGRSGWSRILPKVVPGFETVYHVMRKEIKQESPCSN